MKVDLKSLASGLDTGEMLHTKGVRVSGECSLLAGELGLKGRSEEVVGAGSLCRDLP